MPDQCKMWEGKCEVESVCGDPCIHKALFLIVEPTADAESQDGAARRRVRRDGRIHPFAVCRTASIPRPKLGVAYSNVSRVPRVLPRLSGRG